MAQLMGMYTDQIVSVGSVRRLYMRFLMDMGDGTKRWLYFGSTPETYPPPQFQNAPYSQYDYVQLPQDITVLGEDADMELFMLGRKIALKREGWE